MLNINNIPTEHKQIILGSLLGSGFICTETNCHICIQHTKDFEPYLRSKVVHLTEYSRNKSFYNRGNNTVGWRSSAGKLWNDFKALCYKDDKKVISEEWLHPLRAIALAVWYQDSGCLTKTKASLACLRTQSFGKAGNEMILNYFNEVGLECKIKKSKDSGIIVFSEAGTEEFIKLTVPYMHPTLHTKLIPNYLYNPSCRKDLGYEIF